MANVIQGSSADDYLLGTSEADDIRGGGGRDNIQGAEGDDTLRGDAGNDMLTGGSGADTYVFARGDGQDTIFPNEYWDGGQPDTLQFAGAINMADVLVQQDGADLLLKLKTGHDSVRVNKYFDMPETDRLHVAFGDGVSWDAQAINRELQTSADVLTSTTDAPWLNGGPGDDVLMGSSADDTLYGGTGSDFMEGGEGSDTYLFGRGDGQDRVFSSAPSATNQPDRLLFGVGISMADVDVSQDGGRLVLSLHGSDDQVTIDNYFMVTDGPRALIQFTDGGSWDAQAIDRKLHGAPDMLYGTQGNDVLDGGAGDDVIAGMDGNDTLYGDAGNDRLFGGMGRDTYLFGRGDGRDVIQGGDAELMDDQLVLAGDVNVTDIDVRADGSDLVLSIQDSTDSVRMSGYFITPYYGRPSIRFASGAAWDAAMVDNKVQRSSFVPFPKPGDTFIEGGMGDDHLQGTDADETLYGDGGQDWMDGGSGLDTYLFGRGDGQDTVMAGQVYGNGPAQADRLVFGANISIADISVKQRDMDLLVRIHGSGDSVLLSNYFGAPISARMLLQFADGSRCDALAVDRMLNASSDFVGAQPDNNTLDGGLGDDNIQGTPGDDILYGDAGQDMLMGGAGIDTYWFGVGDGQDTIVDASFGTERLADKLRFGHGITLADVDVSQVGRDLLLSLLGGGDSVQVQGYFDQAWGMHTRIQFADGSSMSEQSVNRKLYAGDETLYGQDADDLLDGGLGNDSLFGQEGNDTLYGDAGNDWLDGGAGADTYLFGRGDGYDSIASDGTYSAGQQDQLVLGSGITAADITVIRDSMNNGNLQLKLIGSDDQVQVLGYFSSPSNQLLVRFADGMVWDYAAIDRKLNAYYPDDTYYGSATDDVYDGGNGNDSIYGLGGHDVLYGGAGNDYLDGGDGADTCLYGLGDGSDTVISGVDPGLSGVSDTLRFGSGLTSSDVLASMQGNDLLLSIQGSSTDQVSVRDYFSSPIPDRMLIQFANGFSWDGGAIDRKLNASDDQLTGTADNDALEGGLGNDTLQGLGGNDMLSGSEGLDWLDGGAGADTMVGGAEDDTYVVDNVRDFVVEKKEADGLLSYDTIRSSVSYTAPDFVEAIVLTGADNINATANNAGCDLTGNIGNNYLKGGDGLDFIFGDDGMDTLEGGAGDDYYYLTDNQDTVIEQQGGGLDQIWAYGDGIKMADNVERLYMKSFLARTAFGNDGKNYMLGNNRDNTLYGYAGDDALSGLAGNDAFYGGLGNDSLYGATGNDRYYFQRGDGADTIYDNDPVVGSSDKLEFQGAVSSAQVWLTKSANDLVVSIIGTTDKVTITNWFLGSTFQVESIVADGNARTLSASKVQGLVNAMSAFSPPPLGQTTLTSAYANALGNVLASSWK